MRFRIEFYSALWKDWIYFDQTFYKTEQQAQDRVNEYKDHKTGLKLRITQTTILDEKPRRTRSKDTQSVRVERP